ncbi:MAG: undecaprenyl-phosphate glucose phosphotransferase [Candidatus Lokiarchaeota archaeon]|nr:undecaprenyl-phosphate glucose phosphotransferase [Candidatus Lokiarchaeota archaeon]
MNLNKTTFSLMRLFLDFLCMGIAYTIAIIFASEGIDFHYDYKYNIIFIILIFIWYFSFNSTKLKSDFRGQSFTFEILYIFKNVIIQIISLMLLLFIIKEKDLTRLFVLYYFFALFFLLLIQKFILRKILELLRKRGRNIKNVLLVGADELAKNFFNEVISRPHYGFNLIGFIDDKIKEFLESKYLGGVNQLEKIIKEINIDFIIVALPNYASSKTEEIVKVAERYAKNVMIIPDYFKASISNFNVSMIGRFPLLSIREYRINELHWRIAKRTFDTFFSLLFFVVIFSWLFPIIALLIKLNSKGPVFFKQVREGRNNKQFLTYKFRTMRTDCSDLDENGKFKQATKDDPRITKIGKFLRKTNLDELPQFINVLKGEMSVVGPRPHLSLLADKSKEEINFYMVRNLVKPGITGWAQVNGYRGETKKIAQMLKRVEYDIWYIEHWSFFLDIQIIILTIWNMLKGDPNAY